MPFAGCTSRNSITVKTEPVHAWKIILRYYELKVIYSSLLCLVVLQMSIYTLYYRKSPLLQYRAICIYKYFPFSKSTAYLYIHMSHKLVLVLELCIHAHKYTFMCIYVYVYTCTHLRLRVYLRDKDLSR